MNYTGPGNTGELSADLTTAWQARLNQIFDTGVSVAKNERNPPSNDSWFFNPLSDGVENTVVADVRWNAFPKRLTDNFGTKLAAWREGDSTRSRHEEYCEWEVVRNPNTLEVIRVTFTTEVPEYYDFLFENDSAMLLDLYHRFVSTDVALEDLKTIDGRYNPRNKWNMPEFQGLRGVLMHMGFGPNTLGAAVNLAAEATWPSVDGNGNLITDEQGLINCRQFGAPARHSDPHIGAQINNLTRAGNEVSFSGPTGLYVDEVDLSGFETPDGSDVNALMRVARGDADHMMRIVFEAPTDAGFTLGQVKIDGNEIRFGGQIAEKLTIRVQGIARDSGSVPPSINCAGSPINALEALAPVGLENTRRMTPQFLRSAE